MWEDGFGSGENPRGGRRGGAPARAIVEGRRGRERGSAIRVECELGGGVVVVVVAVIIVVVMVVVVVI